MTFSKAAIDDDIISFDCPRCARHNRVPLARVGHKYHCRVKCLCGHLFVAEIEFREKLRKPVDLAGTYEVDSPKMRGACRIIDISRTGIGFLDTGDRQLQPQTQVRLRFKLDDAKRTEITQECRIIHVSDNFVGCRMLTENSGLSFYLLG